MAQAIVNPEEIRRFAARLKQFNNDLMNQLTVLHGQVSGLGQSCATANTTNSSRNSSRPCRSSSALSTRPTSTFHS